jgi:hypothetical protein
MRGTNDGMMLTPDLVAAYAALFVHNAEHYAVQQRNGSYWHVPAPLTLDLIAAHLEGRITLGTYLLDRASCCRFAVFDADSSDGLAKLVHLHQRLAIDGIPSLLEASRRGAHLWLHFVEPTPAALVRAWLLPHASDYGVELYPKQDTLGVGGSGSVIRLPLGVHRKSRGWYPFLTVTDGGLLVPAGDTVAACCAWASETVRQAAVPAVEVMGVETDQDRCGQVARDGRDQWATAATAAMASHETIRAWCDAQDCRAVIGRYVDLDRRGVGSCPIKAHHYRGDHRPSFQTFHDHWFCYTWGRAGDLFDFLCLYHGLTPQEGWQRLQAGALV